ncbi:MAG: carboxypeptidase-like regulatory domain-containing protein [Planctomycetota bacterium]
MRGAVRFGLVIAGLLVAAVLALLGWDRSERKPRRVDGASRPAAAAEASTAPKRAAAARRARVRVTDWPDHPGTLKPDEVRDDLNRLPGGPIRIRGRVMRSGRAVAGARVRLHRAYFAHSERAEWGVSLPTHWRKEQDRSPLKEVRTDEAGEFELACKRRSRVVLEASDGKGRVRRELLHLPLQGQPDPISIHLADGVPVVVRVVRPDGAAVPNRHIALVCSASAGSSVAMRSEPWDWSAGKARRTRAPMLVREAYTDPSGRARFEHVGAGLLVIRAGRVEETVVVPTGGEIAFVEARPARVTGVLRDRHGRPVSRATLELEVATAWQRIARLSAITGADGTFVFDDVPPGSFHAGYVEGRGAIEVQGRMIRSGESVEWRPRLQVEARIVGSVEMGDGRPVPGAVVTISGSDGDVGRGVSGPSGEFELVAYGEGPFVARAYGYGVVGAVAATPDRAAHIVMQSCSRVVGRIPGVSPSSPVFHTVTLVAEGFERRIGVDSHGRFAFEHVPPLRHAEIRGQGAKKSGRFDLEAGQVIEVELERVPGRTVRGVVRTADGTPVAGALVRASSLPGFLDMALVQPAWPGNTKTGEDGSYVAWLPLRRGCIRVLHPDFIPIESKKMNLEDTREEVRYDVTLRRGESLGGTLRWADGSPMRHASVHIQPLERPRGRFAFPRSTVTDADGRFLFRGLHPGRYIVTAVDASVSVGVSHECETGRSDHVLRVEHPGVIEGIVVDDRGQPCRATFATHVEAGEYLGVIGPGGRFRIAGLPQGRYDVSISNVQGGGHSIVRGVETGTTDVVLRYGRREFDMQPSADGESVEITSKPIR